MMARLLDTYYDDLKEEFSNRAHVTGQQTPEPSYYEAVRKAVKLADELALNLVVQVYPNETNLTFTK